MTTMSPVVVLGVVGNDIHVVANRVLEYCLQQAGFMTVNIGTNIKLEEFSDVALETSADAVLIGSLNGEAQHWSHGLRRRFTECGMPDMLIYLGGNLVTGDLPTAEVEQSLLRSGISRVFHGAIDFDEMIAKLKEDLSLGHS